jgi:hypothetical protein
MGTWFIADAGSSPKRHVVFASQRARRWVRYLEKMESVLITAYQFSFESCEIVSGNHQGDVCKGKVWR